MRQSISEILLRYSRDGIILFSGDLKIKIINQVARHIIDGSFLKNKKKDISLLDLFKRCHLETLSLKEIKKQLKEKKRTDLFVVRFLNFSGKKIPLEIIIDKEIKKEEEVFCLIARDITSSKQKEEEIQKSLQKIQEAKEKAERSDQLKMAFLSNMSHEIRTPMNSILGFSELLDDKNIGPQERSEIVKIIQSNSEKLLELISNIIEVSRLQSGDLELNKEEINLNKFLKAIVTQWRMKLPSEKRHLRIDLRMPDKKQAYILADNFRLKNVFDNLLDNAIKFTSAGTVEVGYFFDKDRVKMYVRDNGVGIMPEKKAEIFETFNKFNVTETEIVSGIGIGLTLVKNLVELMGGNVYLESTLKKGSTFFIDLPTTQVILRSSREFDRSSLDVLTYSWPDKKILVVEDNTFNYEYLHTVLYQRVWEIVWARTGKEALDAISEKWFDLVLLDLHLPDMHGLEVLQFLKRKRNDLPVIAQTAYAIVGDRQKIIEAGCDDYMSKPIKPETLLKTVDKFLKKERSYENKGH